MPLVAKGNSVPLFEWLQTAGGEYVDSHYRGSFLPYTIIFIAIVSLLIIFTLAYSIYRWIADSGH